MGKVIGRQGRIARRSDRGPGLCAAHRPEGFRGHRRLNHFPAVRRRVTGKEGPTGTLLLSLSRRRVPPCRRCPFPSFPCGGSRGSEALVTTTEKKKKFIVDCAYLALILALGYAALQYALPLLLPFVVAFVIAYVLRRPIRSSPGRCTCPGAGGGAAWWSSPTGSSAPCWHWRASRLAVTITTLVEQIPRVLLHPHPPRPHGRLHLAGGPAVQAGPLPDGGAGRTCRPS